MCGICLEIVSSKAYLLLSALLDNLTKDILSPYKSKKMASLRIKNKMFNAIIIQIPESCSCNIKICLDILLNPHISAILC